MGTNRRLGENDALRASFNDLTRQTFGFDFVDWYDAGGWGAMYIPHAIIENGKVVSNISVNHMKFDVCGVEKNYIQLGTVMTDREYRGQGLNRKIMELILKEYAGKVDGIYLFANDSVLDYYPKFGFKASKEYEYYLPCNHQEKVTPYLIEKIDIKLEQERERFYHFIANYKNSMEDKNENDGIYMSENIGLYQFWMAEYGKSLYYLPKMNTYVIACIEGKQLLIHQIFGKTHVEINCLAKCFGKNIEETVLGYTPVWKTHFSVREHKEENCTLFVLGEDLRCVEKDKMKFPVLSHA